MTSGLDCSRERMFQCKAQIAGDRPRSSKFATQKRDIRTLKKQFMTSLAFSYHAANPM